jgi:hypothetical protein
MSRCAKHVLQANETALVLLQRPVPVAAAPFKRRTSLIPYHGLYDAVPVKRHGSGMEGPGMSLSAREQQALNSIRDGLAGSDPELATLLATFTEQASGEEMPPRENIRVTPALGHPAVRPGAVASDNRCAGNRCADRHGAGPQRLGFFAVILILARA